MSPTDSPGSRSAGGLDSPDSSRSPLRPAVPRRIAVAGTSGSGKTTLCRRLAESLGLPHTEIDSLFHGPDWQPRPAFLDDVRAVLARPAWVIEWQYASARPLIAARADLLVWLDPPTPVVMWQITRRTIARRLRREELWNGNREAPLRTLLTDPDHIIRWAWRTRRSLDRAIPELARELPDLPIVHLRSRPDVDRWIASMPREAG